MKPDDKLQISWDELKSDSVEQKLREREVISSTNAHYETAQIQSVPKASRPFGFLYNTIIYLSLFGILGGLLGWGFGEILHFTNLNLQAEARDLTRTYDDIVESSKAKGENQATIDKRVGYLKTEGKNNPYFNIYVDPTLSDDEKVAQTKIQIEKDQGKDFIANLMFYGVSGMMIAIMLAIADSVIDRNINGAIIYGSIGALLGVAGGLCVALVVNKITDQMLPVMEVQTINNRMLTQVICWGLLGLFLAATPGLILRNSKRLIIGMIGGLIGGAIGGLVYVPVEDAFKNQHISRLIAILLIGLISGLACGVIENVVKAGWIKVVEGLIAGKQFVLYRNPTFIGSAPMSHIYLFNDQHVGRRHACIHIVSGVYELEDLPLGTRTYINGKPITRQRLRNGDQIQVGSTVFLFQERAK